MWLGQDSTPAFDGSWASSHGVVTGSSYSVSMARAANLVRRGAAAPTAIALLAAFPSILWAARGADYLTDDFPVARLIAREGLLQGGWQLGTVGPARPAAAPYYLLVYDVIGANVIAQALLLAALNALVAVIVWRALLTVVSEHTALLAATVFAVAPNRGATRLWFQLGPYLVALACLAVGAALLLGRDRYVSGAALVVLSILTYEGVAGVALLCVGGWLLQQRGRRWPPAAAVVAVAGSAIATMWVLSPKRDAEGPGPFDHVDTIGSGVLGAGFWGNELLGAIGILAVLLAVTLTLVTFLPSYRRHDLVQREVLIGAAIVVMAVGPFVVGGAPFAARGIFDRNNLVPGIGVSLIVGALLAAAWRWRAGTGAVLAAGVVTVLAVGNVQDVQDYRAAVREGRALERDVVRDIDPTIGTVVVLPPLAGERGVAQFILDNDLTAALELHYGSEWSSVSMPYRVETCRHRLEAALEAGRPALIYDRLTRHLELVDSAAACDVA